MQECLRVRNYQAMLYWIPLACILSYFTTYVLVARLGSDDYHDWKFAFGILTFTDTTRSPNYEIACIYQIFSIVSTAIHFSTIDLLIAGVLCHITYDLKILHANFQSLVKNSTQSSLQENQIGGDLQTYNGDRIFNRHLERSLKQAIEFHLSIISISKQIEELFSILLLLTYLGTLGILCFDTFYASNLHVNDPLFAANVLQMFFVIFQILMVCYWGDELKFASVRVGNAAYESDFVGRSLAVQKALVMVTVRSGVPIKLTIGKFADISMPAFTWVIRTSYSAFMVLHHKNMKLKEA